MADGPSKQLKTKAGIVFAPLKNAIALEGTAMAKAGQR
jgi:hypothetical protein